MMDNNTPKRIMRRRGRPRKSTTDNSPTRKTRTLRFTEEEVKHIAENARRCRKNFSEYCRQVLMGYKPGVPDPELRDGLFAARKDMVNFINNIRGAEHVQGGEVEVPRLDADHQGMVEGTVRRNRVD